MRSLTKFLSFFILILFLVSLFFFRDSFYNLFLFFEKEPVIDYERLYQELSAENEYLHSLLDDKEKNDSLPASLKSARIYSRYPFADHSFLIVDLGAKDGIVEGMPVLVKERILLGKIVKVKSSFSEIQTIFDPAWRSSAGIGSQRTKALLIGGLTPDLELIEPTAIVNDGDSIINISPDFPFGLVIGKLKNLDKPLSQPWFKAELEVSFDINSLKEVLIITDFKD
ncbi:MAG: rod shape-determining protein MreC [bacterium]|nr:rod shape-determining protein MreC [bacterium]